MVLSYIWFLKKTTSNIKIYQVFSSTGLDNVDIYQTNGQFSSDVGIVNLHQLKGRHWDAFVNEKCFGSYDCAPPQKLSRFIMKQNGNCLYSQYKIQGLKNKRDCYGAAYCLHKAYLAKVLRRDFESAVLNLYYQMVQ